MSDLQQENSALAAEAAKTLLVKSGVKKFDIALTLGSGWGKSAEAMGEIIAEVPASEVPGFHANGVIGHSGKLTALRLPDGRNVLIIGARTHLYEGRGVDAVAHGVRTAHAAGVETLVLTNGAGGVNPDYGVGEVVLISDHLNLTAVSPLKGAEFVDLTDLYALELRAIAREVAPELREGVYAQLPGPHFETPAEIRYLQTIGADAVGMSTALEAITARSLGLKVLGLSFVTNPAAGLQDEPLSHAEVIAAGKAAESRLSELLTKIVHRLP
ncbi:purine-nucleoside phosphorylase [Canibacter zhoujuaniae]|uniref:purine-nucleoside phosphorylase n=1 Tax=Canibacter zhoujuaniae TaxID=2708343 RepID=UPI0014234F9D|nr:purine-nucleoside phosphorylase [Canibacter zhoujuaniae]